ncbi:UNVERIFIED_CONTAM: hypothetical protein GTU68_024943 [Idotea baltica]|nr:hypothetical protein [Idotea baltica]
MALPDWQPAHLPPMSPMTGRFGRLEILDADVHTADLWHAFCDPNHAADWTYLSYGPFDSFDSFSDWIRTDCVHDDPLFHVIIDAPTGKPIGLASYLRIEPSAGTIEVGHIHYSKLLQKKPLATEAMFLMMLQAFDDLGYRRYEWKCDALNQRSRNAALRLGFTFEGIFRQAAIYKGRSRDTAWFSITDNEWPQLKTEFYRWLDPENFDVQGRQRKRLRP